VIMTAAQAPSAVVLIRPHRFAPNPETAADNAFQITAPRSDGDMLARRAYREASTVAAALAAAGVTVHLFEDSDATRPDSVFPNNWFSTHSDGRIALHPMFCSNRRTERRHDIIDTLKAGYRVSEVVDHSASEHDGLFLEGTGAMVIDHRARVAYAAISNRAHTAALHRFCAHFDYEPLEFATADHNGIAVYHTNVLMCIATEFALVGLDLISDHDQRESVASRLRASGRQVIGLGNDQIRNFAGNAIELQGVNGRFLAMSARALASLSPHQRRAIERSCPILPLDVPTIELAGGSVRCMIAGIHLLPRDPLTPRG